MPMQDLIKIRTVFHALRNPCCLSHSPKALLSFTLSGTPAVFHTLRNPCCLSHSSEPLLSFTLSGTPAVFHTLRNPCCLSHSPEPLLSFTLSGTPAVFQTLRNPCFHTLRNPAVFHTLRNPCCLLHSLEPLLSFSFTLSGTPAVFLFHTLRNPCCLSHSLEPLLSFTLFGTPAIFLFHALRNPCCRSHSPEPLLSFTPFRIPSVFLTSNLPCYALPRMAPCCFVHCSERRRAVLYTAQNGTMLLRITGIITIHFHLTERLLCCLRLRPTEISYSLLGMTRARAVGFLYLRSLTPNIFDASKKKKKKKGNKNTHQKNRYSDGGELARAARLVYCAVT